MKKLVLFAVLSSALLGTTLVWAESQPLSDAQINAIRANCSSAQVNLRRIQQSEKPTRINRGYLYESTLRLMVAFNTRVAQNKVDAQDMLTITSEFEKNFQDFSKLYSEYDDGLSGLIKLTCRDNPTGFYDQLEEARSQRNTLNNYTITLDQLLDQYQKNLDIIKSGLGVSS